ncbi:hypothetical protein FHX82_002157 [Amycolatopsis bartoniae]|nr:DUF6779 domain-containing protein [Amycolatopsis bartoniae]MBB2935137.1 hypothetical protein [Amycolatopsis bartoniae]TVT07013.1 hypothetical protein FNH07_17900 [Amycolatopsis bartoniae]
MTGVGDDDSRGRLLGRPWFVVGLALALAATLALVLADDIRYLRLGIVAALWAALVGAFLAVKYRKQAAGTEDAIAQAQEVYELELEREVAARREYELEVENDMRAKVQADSREELDSLRAEVAALRDNLQALFGGEVLLERFALTAQATRMRALREEQRIVEGGSNGHDPAQLTAGRGPERPTEMVDRVREKQQARPAGRPAAPEPRRPERSLDLPPRRVPPAEPAQRQPGGHAASSVAKAAAEARAQQTRVNQPPPRQQEPPTRFTSPVEATRPAFSPSERRRQPVPPAKPDPADEPTQLAKPVDADWTAAWDKKPGGERSAPGNTAPATPEPPAVALPSEPEQPRRAERSRPRMEPARSRAEESRPRFEPARSRGESSRSRMEPVQRRGETSRSRIEPVKPRFEGSRPRMEAVKPRFEGSRPQMEPVRPAEPEPIQARLEPEPVAPPPPVVEELPMASNPTLPDEVRRLAQEGRPGGRRRRAEDEPQVEQSSGRRHRPEGEPPSWLAPTRTGSHAKPEPETGGRRSAESTGRRAAVEEGGSHSAGRSVSDLLAAHGTTDAIPRRRRRAED